ncbi:MAG: cytochrome b N-terminal domain-containing protein [Pyrinomonadaceae bacterium]
MKETEQIRPSTRASRLARWTTLADVVRALADEPETGWRAWLRTTAGLVVLLLALQLCTGVLLACYYVPAAESAHTTVAFIEKAVGGGSWLRALHVYGSVLLPCALILHLLQKLWRGSHRRRPVGWLASVALLGLALAAGGTGYTLPWDARAYYSTHVAEGLVRGLPVIGDAARRWLLGGPLISTLSISRLFALHVLALPFLILTTVVARLFIFRDRDTGHDTVHDEQAPLLSPWLRVQLARHALVAGLAFVSLALYAAKYPAPFGPRADAVPAEYLPRPGAQFLWLFELLKHTSGAGAAFVGLILPGLLLALLALVPRFSAAGKTSAPLRRYAGPLVFGATCVLVLGLTALAWLADTRDARVRDQLNRQTAAEESFRRAPFIPQRPRATDSDSAATPAANTNGAAAQTGANVPPPPVAYTQNCVKCHGAHGEGVRPNPKLIGVAEQPHRTVADLIAILNDPAAYGLEKPMTSFADKLTEDEKRQIAEWIEGLK